MSARYILKDNLSKYYRDVPTIEPLVTKTIIMASSPHKSEIIYSVNDIPPWYIAISLGLQHYLMMFGSTVAIPFIICPMLCMEDDDPAKGYIISTIFFVSGIVTFLQCTFGTRLPIVQGGTFSFLAPTAAILALEKWKCPDDFQANGWGNITLEAKTENWQIRMREIQGSIIIASIFQLLVGYLGIIGFILKFITPLTIVPAVTMVGLALIDPAADLAGKHWGVSGGTILIMILFSQYLKDVSIPIIRCSTSEGVSKSKFPIFKIFPVLLTIITMWLLCLILTVTDVFSPESSGRTDTKIKAVHEAVWFRLPMPFQWGIPTISASGVSGMLAGVIASTIESVGDYYACAKLSEAPPPPTHAINRGIGTEGLGCIIAGIWGTGNGTTSYSENVGAVGITKVGSRRVIQYGSLMMIFFGLFPKFGAFFVTLPEPIIGGIFIVLFGIIAGVGLSNLQYVDLNSTRNLFIIGYSLFVSLLLPRWLKSEENKSVINTGSSGVDQVLYVMLSTPMFVGGFLGCVLDNGIPGSMQERGLTRWREEKTNINNGYEDTTYDFPFGMKFIKRFKWMQYIPISPTFKY